MIRGIILGYQSLSLLIVDGWNLVVLQALEQMPDKAPLRHMGILQCGHDLPMILFIVK